MLSFQNFNALNNKLDFILENMTDMKTKQTEAATRTHEMMVKHELEIRKIRHQQRQILKQQESSVISSSFISRFPLSTTLEFAEFESELLLDSHIKTQLVSSIVPAKVTNVCNIVDYI